MPRGCKWPIYSPWNYSVFRQTTLLLPLNSAHYRRSAGPSETTAAIAVAMADSAVPVRFTLASQKDESVGLAAGGVLSGGAPARRATGHGDASVAQGCGVLVERCNGKAAVAASRQNNMQYSSSVRINVHPISSLNTVPSHAQFIHECREVGLLIDQPR